MAMNPEQEKALYVEQLRGGIKFRNKFDRIKRWKQYARICAYNFVTEDSVESPVVNLIASRVRSQAPQLAFADPTFDVTCVGAMPEPNSEVAVAAALERTWRDEEFQGVFTRTLMDWPLYGRGIFYVGFEAADEGEVLDAKRNVATSMEQYERQKAGRSLVDKARDFLGMKSDKPFDPPSEVQTFKMLLRQRVFVEQVSPFDFVIDPCAPSPDKAAFMGRRIYLPKERAMLMFGKDCPVADSLANSAIYTDESTDDPFAESTTSQSDDLPDEVKRVEVWEMWNIVTRRTCYIDKSGKPLGEPFDWKSAHPGFPFVLLDWDEVPGSVWPEGLPAAGITLNNEINEIRRRQLAELSKAFSIVVIPEGMTKENEKSLQEAKDRCIIRLNPEDAAQVQVLSTTSIPPDTFSVENRAMANFDEVTRTSAQQSGAMSQVRRTATETSIANSGLEAAIMFRQAQVEEAAAKIAERMAAAMFATFDEPMTVRIVNKDEALAPVGQTIEYPFVGVDHAGFYRVRVTAGSMASVAKDVERQQFLALRQTLAGSPHINIVEIDRHLLTTYPSVKDAARFFVEEQPEPQADVEESQEGFHMMPDGTMMPDAMMQQPMGGAMMPPNGMMPMNPNAGLGSGIGEADILAATYGGGAPMTGPNGSNGF